MEQKAFYQTKKFWLIFAPIVVAVFAIAIIVTVLSPAKPVNIYDRAEIHDVLSGSRDTKIGEYSLIKATSDEVDMECITDWYTNYVKQHDYNWCVIVYTDKSDHTGVFANQSYVIKDATIEQDAYGDYMLTGNSGTTYFPAADGTLAASE